MRENKYHGVNLSMSGPLFVISEPGYPVNGLPGDSQRLGNYKVGGWYDHSKLTDFESGARRRGRVFAAFSTRLVPFGTHRGFGIFGSVTVAPDSHVQQLPLYYTAGALARGLLSAGPRDVVGFGIASG